MPLHWKRATDLAYVTSVRSARGILKFAPTSSFEYALPSVGVLPALPVIPGSLDEPHLKSLVRNFVAEGSSSWNSANDTYWSGKAVGRVAEVLAIADQLKMTAEAATLRDWLKEELADWMSAERNGTLTTKSTLFTTISDSPWPEESFASHQQLNDHRFHYGYLCVRQLRYVVLKRIL